LSCGKWRRAIEFDGGADLRRAGTLMVFCSAKPFVFKDGGKMQQEEVAWQTWRGEKIATETFFYDPAQRG
jgi:hypothetical protein